MKPVLYAEDDANDVFFMEHAWKAAQIPNPLVHVKDGTEAIDYLAGNGSFSDRAQYPLPCLLLLDVKMPGKGGFEVLRWIRQRREIAGLKVIILSASNQDVDREAGQKLGILDYAIKTPAPKRMLQLVQRWKSMWLEREQEGFLQHVCDTVEHGVVAVKP